MSPARPSSDDLTVPAACLHLLQKTCRLQLTCSFNHARIQVQIFNDGNGVDNDDVNNAMKAACDTKQEYHLQSVQ